VLPTNEQTPTTGGTQGETVTNNVGQPATSQGTSGGTLPFTGSDVVELTLIGLGAIGTGTIMVRRSRARRVEA